MLRSTSRVQRDVDDLFEPLLLLQGGLLVLVQFKQCLLNRSAWVELENSGATDHYRLWPVIVRDGRISADQSVQVRRGQIVAQITPLVALTACVATLHPPDVKRAPGREVPCHHGFRHQRQCKDVAPLDHAEEHLNDDLVHIQVVAAHVVSPMMRMMVLRRRFSKRCRWEEVVDGDAVEKKLSMAMWVRAS